MITTKLYNATNPEDLQESINLFLKEKNITRENLIDIKYQQVFSTNPDYKQGMIKYVAMFSALIIYKTIRPEALKSSMKLTRPLEHYDDEIADASY